MPKFALRFPYFILMLCLMVALVGVVNLSSMPVDLFPEIDMPVPTGPAAADPAVGTFGSLLSCT